MSRLSFFAFLCLVGRKVEEEGWCRGLVWHLLRLYKVRIGRRRLELEGLVESSLELMELSHRLQFWKSLCGLLLRIQDFVQSYCLFGAEAFLLQCC